MKLAVDIDGCLSDFNGGFADALSQVTGEPIGYSPSRQPAVWDWPAEHATDGEVQVAWENIHADPEFWYDLRPMPLARETLTLLNTLERKGHQVYFITLRSGVDVKGQTERWLMRHGAFQPTVLIAHDKRPIIAGLGCEVAIDDRPENLDGLPATTRGYLVERPYNAGVTGYSFSVVSDVYEALQREGLTRD